MNIISRLNFCFCDNDDDISNQTSDFYRVFIIIHSAPSDILVEKIVIHSRSHAEVDLVRETKSSTVGKHIEVDESEV